MYNVVNLLTQPHGHGDDNSKAVEKVVLIVMMTIIVVVVTITLVSPALYWKFYDAVLANFLDRVGPVQKLKFLSRLDERAGMDQR